MNLIAAEAEEPAASASSSVAVGPPGRSVMLCAPFGIEPPLLGGAWISSRRAGRRYHRARTRSATRAGGLREGIRRARSDGTKGRQGRADGTI